MKILFFGTDYYSTLAMRSLMTATHEHEIAGVVTTTKKSSMPFAYESPYEFAQKADLPTILVHSGKELAEAEERLKGLHPDIGLVASFGFLIPKSIYEAPAFGTLNIHPSLLPRYRGVSPMQQTILDGIEETGVTLMKINEQFDEGDIIAQKKAKIESDDNTASLASRLFPLGVELFMKSLDDFPNGDFPTQPQHGEPSHTKKITKEQAYIEFDEPPSIIHRKIRAFYPKPLAWTHLSKLVKHYVPDAAIPAKWDAKRVLLLDTHMDGDNLIIDKLQLEGKRPINWRQFQSGYLNGSAWTV